MKKFLTLAVALMLVLGLACSVSADAIKLNLSEVHVEGYPTTMADEHFAELVKERTDGRIEITVYPGGTLYGAEPLAIEAMVVGDLAFARVSASPVADFVPAMNAIQLPYLYKNAEHMWAALNSEEIGQKMLDEVQSSGSGMIGLCYYDGGSRCFYTTKKVEKVADLAGLKIRMQDNALMCDLVKVLGASPVVGIGPNEVSQNITSGVIDGAENNWPTYESKGDYKAAPYYTLDHHTRVPEVLLASETALASAGVSAEDIEIIKQCAKDTQEFEIEAWKAREVESEKIVLEGGAQAVELTDEAFAEFQKAMTESSDVLKGKSLYDIYAAGYEDTVEAIKTLGEQF
ncbi:TRAP transporter substrate-binding protein DctP [Beduinella massiliensis]|uniref:TRAP transporter substrate-binding protein DctP n=1 Tax=Beduinella massiliensis TaxID=1852363 RepID=UPI000C830F89